MPLEIRSKGFHVSAIHSKIHSSTGKLETTAYRFKHSKYMKKSKVILKEAEVISV